MSDRIDNIATDLKKVQHGLEEVEQAVTTLSQSVDAAFVQQRQYTESAYERLDRKMDEGFTRLERKLDQFIDVQLTTNDLVDRRLRALESGQRRPKRR